ncbi:MAG TPA: ankyrin repeat domain-containing protein [Blastocatellia bacterium]|nr:ankyrin repeat domain-containing protein [Blastocatellia bacterium]
MTNTSAKELVEALRSHNLARIKAILRRDPAGARSPRPVIEAGRLAWKSALGLLVRNGADINASARGYRPLHSLIQEKPHGERAEELRSRVACLKWMLARGADPELLGAFPPTRAIVTAAFTGVPAYVAEIRKAGAVVDGFVAAALGDIKRVERALSKDAAFAVAKDPGGLTALHCCAGSRLGRKNPRVQSALLKIGQLLIDHGADVNARVRAWSGDVDVAYFAISCGQRQLFELLLEHGLDATAALKSAVWGYKMELADLCIAHGAEIDRAMDDGKPLLNQLIRWGQMRQALWLLSRGASPNRADGRGWTAVHQAASRGSENMLKAVLRAGGDPKPRAKNGDTPLEIAEERGRPKIIALLRSS